MNLIEQVRKACAVPTMRYPKRLIVCTHAKYSAVQLCQSLQLAGIEVVFYPVNYSKEADDILQIKALGISVVEQAELLVPHIAKADAVIEDGARVSKIIKQRKLKVKKGFFSVEQTSGGVRFFNEHLPQYPVINVAMSAMKLDIENRRATPESIIRYFSTATGKLLAGKEVLLLGFGSVGEGIARLAQTLGAHVTVYDTLATKRMFAQHHGYAIIEHDEFDHTLQKQDVIFMATNTYQGTMLGIEQLLLMKDGAIICNAGSGRGEIVTDLQQAASRLTHDAIMNISREEGHLVVHFAKNNLSKTITILSESYPINLHLGNGTSHDAIEVVMSLMLLAVLTGPTSENTGLQPLDAKVQECVAEQFLKKTKPARTFAPKQVKTRLLAVSERPYGGVFPFHNELSQFANMSVVRAWFQANSKTRGHYHRRSQESYYVEKGTADILIWPAGSPNEVETYLMEPGDYLIVPENYFHDVHVRSQEDFECLVIATPPFVAWDQFFDD